MNNATARPFPADGSYLEADAGNYRVRLIPTIDGGATLQIVCGLHDIYGEGFADQAEAREHATRWTLALRRIAEGVSGMSVDVLLQNRREQLAFPNDVERFLQRQAEARQAEADQAAYEAIDVEQVKADLNADLDRRDAGYRQEIAELNAHTESVRNPNGWYEARKSARQDIDWGYAGGNHRPVRGTKTQVHRQPLNAVQKRALNLHRDGVVYCGRGTGVSAQTLRSMHDRIGGDLVMHHTVKHRVVGLRLPTAVMAELGQVAA